MLSIENDLDNEIVSMIGLVEIGTPAQPLAMRFDTTFGGAIVQSITEASVAGGALQYNMNTSSTAAMDADDRLYLHQFANGDKISYTMLLDTFDIGGVLFDGVPFGQLHDYYPASSDQLAFNGASGFFGLQHLLPIMENGFMDVIKGQLPSKLQSCCCEIFGH
jgi:hypothetical protein